MLARHSLQILSASIFSVAVTEHLKLCLMKKRGLFSSVLQS
jgi:hypothetical protein